jgi:hypothetical protein
MIDDNVEKLMNEYREAHAKFVDDNRRHGVRESWRQVPISR